MKNYLEYKGYIGTVEFSAEDKVFFGKIHGINDVVTFEGTSVSELEKSFHEGVNDYLETCKMLNKIPDKVFKGSFNVRVSQDLHQKTAMLASKKGLNLNEIVKEALSYIVNHEEVLN
ncbi:type II toxin-antitoxin system HicB family antitoxin [Flavobacterium daemonense]|uniref:type II toxin-antitoxin system HicB family antitoxin n=1 Tax=Flavobacterium daemonense TaxID=1393049 RepID=UPI00118662FC|nr:type II toxin-antitoxin system HicB family antitoxin [Flavobacterium daemonense]KAF2333231.1 type II toxin-antitoxin system HicB family antitoxin [Flavobacterium daemonense]